MWLLSFLRYRQFAGMEYSRCGLTNELYRGTMISFFKHANDVFMKHSIPLASTATVRTLAEGVNAVVTVMSRLSLRRFTFG